jgi:hypothetical protein
MLRSYARVDIGVAVAGPVGLSRFGIPDIDPGGAIVMR